MALRGALAGFGEVAEKAHLPAFLARPDLFKVEAVAESSEERRARARALIPGVRVYADLETLLGREAERVDFVDVATPPFLHAGQVVAALSSGKHVLCEKPLALGHEDRSRMDWARSQASRVVWTVHNWAHAPQWLKIWELLEGIGPIEKVSLQVLRLRPAATATAGNWRSDKRMSLGGILVDHGWHQLYLIHRLLGGELIGFPEDIPSSQGAAEDEALVVLDYPAAQAKIKLTWRASERANTGLIEGRRGAVELQDDLIILRPREGAPTSFPFSEKLSAGSAHPAWFGAMLADFHAAVEGNAELARRNWDEARFCADVIERIYSRSGALALP